MDKKFFFQILGLVIVIFAAIIFTFNQPLLDKILGRPIVKAPVGNAQTLDIVDPGTGQAKARVVIEISNTQETRSLGLGGRQTLGADAGMLFLLEQRTKPTFWMKGMFIPLDMIWIDGDTIADIIGDIPPPVAGQSDENLPRYSPVAQVDKVLEVNSGFVASHGVKVGDKIVLPAASP